MMSRARLHATCVNFLQLFSPMFIGQGGRLAYNDSREILSCVRGSRSSDQKGDINEPAHFLPTFDRSINGRSRERSFRGGSNAGPRIHKHDSILSPEL